MPLLGHLIYSEKGKGNHNREQNIAIIEAKVEREDSLIWHLGSITATPELNKQFHYCFWQTSFCWCETEIKKLLFYSFYSKKKDDSL